MLKSNCHADSNRPSRVFFNRATTPTARQPIRHTGNRNSHWHMSNAIASGVGLTNMRLAEQGLLSLKTLWARLAHLR